jgi:multicomponent Na+:H+ antiporter subunit D
MADLAGRLAERGPSPLTNGVAMLFLLAFGTKAALFPFYFWLPASYHAPPAPVSAIFAGLLTKVGVYALYRTFTLMFVGDTAFTHGWLMALAGLTMVGGLLGAVVQENLRRVLSFNLVGHIGYMVLGLGLFTPMAMAGGIFYTLHDMIDITILFLIAGVIHRRAGDWRMDRLGGFYEAAPFLSFLFLLAAFSLAGIPPLSGFWGKLALIRQALVLEEYIVVAAALLAAFLTLFSMALVWGEVFWKTRPDGGADHAGISRPGRRETAFQMAPIVGLTLLSLAMGLFPEPFFRYAEAAAEGLLEPTTYIRTVLGGTP